MSFTKNLNKLLLIGSVFIGGSMSVESTTLAGLPREITDDPYISDILQKIDFANVISSTVSSSEISELHPLYSIDADNAYGGAETKIDWEQVKSAAEKGNPLAQYIHSGHLSTLSSSLFNGQKRQVHFEACMYLLISAFKGNFQAAIDAYNSATDFTVKVPVFKNDMELLDWIVKEAKRLS